MKIRKAIDLTMMFLEHVLEDFDSKLPTEDEFLKRAESESIRTKPSLKGRDREVDVLWVLHCLKKYKQEEREKISNTYDYLKTLE